MILLQFVSISKYLSLIVIAVGFLFVTIFHFGAKEERYRDTIKTMSNQNKEVSNIDLESVAPKLIPSGTVIGVPERNIADEKKMKTWRDWLKDSRFYRTGILYISTRLSFNVFQSFLVLYLTDALHFQKVGIFLCFIFLFYLPGK